MKEELISFETAQLAKDKGFKVWTEYQYVERNGHISLSNDRISEIDEPAPTQSLLQKWLRETHNIRVFVTQSSAGGFKYEIYTWENPNNIGKWDRSFNATSSLSYEEALEQGLQTALKLI